MQTLVIYDSKFGNTERIAQAIGRGLAQTGDVRLMSTAEAVGFANSIGRPELLFLGGPTQKRGPSPSLRRFLDCLPGALKGVPTFTFDTRYRGATLIMGSAAGAVAKSIRNSGGQLASAPESFFMSRHGPMESQQLEAGEVERAEQWARAMATSTTPVSA